MSVLPSGAEPLSEIEAENAFAAVLDGEADEDAVEAFLIRLADRGEEPQEIAGAARAMRTRMIGVEAPDGAIDVCGTGGDGQHTLNVSTAVSLVVAACGVPVAKHGNRAASSRAGAADTLEALGLDMDGAYRRAEETLDKLGIGFLFAQFHHPALRPLAPLRQRIGRRTIFNLLGPVCNPARVRRQLVGIARPDLVATYANALCRVGSERALVVAGDEGLDELSLAGSNTVARVTPSGFEMGRIDVHEIDIRGTGLARAPLEAIKGGEPHYNAERLTALLDGQRDAYRDAVLLNAAAALEVAGPLEGADREADWQERIALAAEAIDSGKARALLAAWIALSQ